MACQFITMFGALVYFFSEYNNNNRRLVTLAEHTFFFFFLSGKEIYPDEGGYPRLGAEPRISGFGLGPVRG